MLPAASAASPPEAAPLLEWDGREVHDIAIDLNDASTVPRDIALPRLCCDLQSLDFLAKCALFLGVVGVSVWALATDGALGLQEGTRDYLAVTVLSFAVFYTCYGLPGLLGGLCDLPAPEFVEPFSPPKRGAKPTSVLVVFNPASGKLKATAVMAAVRRRLQENNIIFEEWETTGVGCARQILPKAKRHAAVVTVGGDGTYSEVVNALHGSGLPVCVVPAGSGNAIAATLRKAFRAGGPEVAFTPEAAVTQGLDALESGSRVAIDQLEVDLGDGRCLDCAVVALFGLVGEVDIVSEPLRSTL